MQKDALISVIVPVYNVEEYLKRCIDSLVNQTYKNYEIILVDDGSPDACPQICDEYEKKYSNIRVLHQENQGVSVARNNGVKISKGEYISFVDADDYVSKDYIEVLVNAIVKTGADISIAYHKVIRSNDFILEPDLTEKVNIIDAEEALKKIYLGKKVTVAPWNKLYPRNLVEKYPYPEGITIGEDLIVVNKIIGECKKIAVSDKVVYYYHDRQDSACRSGRTEKHVNDELYARETCVNYIKQYYPNVLEIAYSKYIRCIFTSMMLTSNQTDFERIHRDLKIKLIHVYKNYGRRNKYISIEERLTIFVLLKFNYSSRLLYKAWIGYNKFLAWKSR